MDWIYEILRNWWVHPETLIVINDEDMPVELKPKESGNG